VTFGDAPEAAIQAQVARALVEEGLTLLELERPAEALVAYAVSPKRVMTFSNELIASSSRPRYSASLRLRFRRKLAFSRKKAELGSPWTDTSSSRRA
jgi:hypothetical protein